MYDNCVHSIDIEVFASDLSRNTLLVFFDLRGHTESLRTISVCSRVFDNRVRSLAHRKSIHSVCSLRQDYTATGKPVELVDDCPGAIAQLHIHTKAYIAGYCEEASNSFLGYTTDDLGIVPAGEQTADMTDYDGKRGRVSVTHVRRVGYANEEVHTADMSFLETAHTADSTLPYEINLYSDHLDVRLSEQPVGIIPVRRVVNPQDSLSMFCTGPLL